MPLSLFSRIRYTLSRFSPLPLHPLNYGQGLDLRQDLKRCGITPKVIVDVGANIGQSAYAFACLWPAVQVYSFEPVEATYQELCTNVHGLPAVQCYHYALGRKEEEATIHVHSRSGLSSLLIEEETERSERVRVTTLDNFSARRGIARIDLLKIDVEGYEAAVLEGAKGALNEGRVRSVLIEIGFSSSRHTPLCEVQSILKPHGFVLNGYHGQHSYPGTDELCHANALFVISKDDRSFSTPPAA